MQFKKLRKLNTGLQSWILYNILYSVYILYCTVCYIQYRVYFLISYLLKQKSTRTKIFSKIFDGMMLKNLRVVIVFADTEF